MLRFPVQENRVANDPLAGASISFRTCLKFQADGTGLVDVTPICASDRSKIGCRWRYKNICWQCFTPAPSSSHG
jgi:hypothetical protein